MDAGRILFSNHSRWGFFNQFGEFSSLAKFVGGSQEVASPFGSAARYVSTYVPYLTLPYLTVTGLWKARGPEVPALFELVCSDQFQSVSGTSYQR